MYNATCHGIMFLEQGYAKQREWGREAGGQREGQREGERVGQKETEGGKERGR